MTFQGSVDLAYWHSQLDEILEESFLNNQTIGESFKIGKNSDYERNRFNFCDGLVGDPVYILIGDPTFKPR